MLKCHVYIAIRFAYFSGIWVVSAVFLYVIDYIRAHLIPLSCAPTCLVALFMVLRSLLSSSWVHIPTRTWSFFFFLTCYCTTAFWKYKWTDPFFKSCLSSKNIWDKGRQLYGTTKIYFIVRKVHNSFKISKAKHKFMTIQRLRFLLTWLSAFRITLDCPVVKQI